MRSVLDDVDRRRRRRICRRKRDRRGRNPEDFRNWFRNIHNIRGLRLLRKTIGINFVLYILLL